MGAIAALPPPQRALSLTQVIQQLTSNGQCDGNNGPQHVDGGAGLAGGTEADAQEVPWVNATAAALAGGLDSEELHAVAFFASPAGALVLVAGAWTRELFGLSITLSITLSGSIPFSLSRSVSGAVVFIVHGAGLEGVVVDETSVLAVTMLRAVAAMTWASHRGGWRALIKSSNRIETSSDASGARVSFPAVASV